MWKKTLIAVALIGGLNAHVMAETTDGQTKALQAQLSSAEQRVAQLEQALNEQNQKNSDLTTELRALKAEHPDLEAAREQSQHFEMIREQLATIEVKPFSLERSIIPSMYEVKTDRGVIYSNPTGRYLLFGNLFEVVNTEVTNLTEQSLAKLRAEQLKAFEKDMIVYPAKDEKFVVTVFTDTDCGYCQKLHHEMADYNKAGITIRYLAFPRGGERSQTYRDMVSIWCSEDQRASMNAAKNREDIPAKTCDNNVLKQYELGGMFGVNGTPAMVLSDGTMQPGYVPADRLSALLEQMAAKELANAATETTTATQ
ncbi:MULTISPECIES: bifunctional protein-disulfide isomerase/oxidoreductase DsbC [Motilimonas]|uniref:Thiol:disulfide interchange protein n=1 Tax=Motilimonas cestriensis TaxID=2742685 RepID=A0ABS8W9K7_9GAMM|nr:MULTISPECIES: bifunctional protein-disulfide isomerase/oxidoreductase DsbC [Motilimonas]MCE0557563.1 bifunctional protein-disulfide isomerase/oxidoreductase DsbC [Motilimonas sp. E26]MCE2594484.1 bifunctional protein-disulfide isomerase/oxidoreductase DsbC [Motilimonas cestriensis]MDO6524553.1 bifunctional protein-disulfide isomerase/oxidoreductase DsbC [Motilimonas sp. 1_MG-2023]